MKWLAQRGGLDLDSEVLSTILTEGNILSLDCFCFHTVKPLNGVYLSEGV